MEWEKCVTARRPEFDAFSVFSCDSIPFDWSSCSEVRSSSNRAISFGGSSSSRTHAIGSSGFSVMAVMRAGDTPPLRLDVTSHGDPSPPNAIRERHLNSRAMERSPIVLLFYKLRPSASAAARLVMLSASPCLPFAFARFASAFGFAT